MVERLGADVEKEQRIRGQLCGLPEYRGAANAIELVRFSDPLRDVERILRVDGVLAARPCQRLVADQRAAFDAPDRLECDAERRSGDEPAANR